LRKEFARTAAQEDEQGGDDGPGCGNRPFRRRCRVPGSCGAATNVTTDAAGL